MGVWDLMGGEVKRSDRVYGEKEQPLTVAPPLGVWIEPGVAVFPTASANARQFLLVRVRNHRPTEQKGVVRLNLPSGWLADPPTKDFTLARQDEIAVRFQVSTAPAAPAGR